MIRTNTKLTRLLLGAAVVAAIAGCNADKARTPGSQLATPVTPVGFVVFISSSTSVLTAGGDSAAQIHFSARSVPDGVPVADGTIASVTTTLGSLNQPSGARSLELEMFGGEGLLTLFPGDTQGTARVRVEVFGAIAVVDITILQNPDDGEPAEPAPTASSITLLVEPGTVSDEVAETLLTLTAIVRGSDGEPFRRAGVNFSTPVGSLASGGSIIKTNSAGEAVDVITLTDDELEAFAGNSFVVTATVGLVGGGTRSATFTVQIARGEDPVASQFDLFLLPDSTVQRDSGSQVTTLQARILDQFGDGVSGLAVDFSTALGTLSGGSVDANTDTTDGSGVAEVTLTVTEGELDVFAGSSFGVSASSGALSDSQTITVTGDPGEDPVATTVDLTLAPDSTVVRGSATDPETVTLNALVLDQFLAPMSGVSVSFTTQLGSLTALSDTTDGSGMASVTLSVTQAQLASFVGSSFNTTASIPADNDVEAVTVANEPVAAPIASFSVTQSPDITDNGAIGMFTDTSTGGAVSTWAWDLDGDGTTDDSNIPNPSYDYDANGFVDCDLVNVTLLVTNASGSSSTTTQIQVTDSGTVACP